jgi:hypothetical protein
MRRITFFLIGLAAVALVTALLMPFYGAPPPVKAPSDQSLASELRLSHADYDSLLRMFVADSGFGRVAYDFTRPANFFSGTRQADTTPMTASKLAAYRSLFDRLSLTGGIEGYDQKHVIYFWRYTSGFGAGLGGSGKGLAYSDSLPIDRPSRFGCTKSGGDCTEFRPIGNRWFILDDHNN